MLTTKNVYDNIDKASIQGKQNLSQRNSGNDKVNLDSKLKEKISNSRIDESEYIAMEQFAKLLPRGKRKLKLNMPELRTEVLSNPKLEPLTEVSGLKNGGLVAVQMNGNAVKGSKKIKEMGQKDYSLSIKNNNRVSNYLNLNNGKNPNYSSFKNKFILK
jgi:hypothetical protein